MISYRNIYIVYLNLTGLQQTRPPIARFIMCRLMEYSPLLRVSGMIAALLLHIALPQLVVVIPIAVVVVVVARLKLCHALIPLKLCSEIPSNAPLSLPILRLIRTGSVDSLPTVIGSAVKPHPLQLLSQVIINIPYNSTPA